MKGYLPGLILFLVAYDRASCRKVANQEPRCNSKLNDNYKLLEKLAKLEEKHLALQKSVGSQNDLIKQLQEELRVSLLPRWGDWSPSSDCYMNCTGKHGGRVQTRSRETIAYSTTEKPYTETEERPCNAVQFAGCVKSFGTDDNFGVTYDFADQIAVSTCTAISTTGGHIFAIRRTCSNLAVSCEDTCKNVKTTCFNALHVYRHSYVLKRNQDGAKGLKVYRYNGCGGSFCGPNYCCCRE